MRTHPDLKLATLLGLFLLALLVATPSPTHAVDRSKYAGIEDDEASPLPAYASEQDRQLLDQLLESRAFKTLALPGPPSGTLWTPGEYQELEGVMIRWGSYNALLTEFVVGVTAANSHCTGSGVPYACCAGWGTGTCDTPSTRVWILVEDAGQQSSATSTLTSAGADMGKVEFITYDGDSVWIRDYGPRFVYEDPTRVIIDHTYNRPTRPKDNAFNEFLAASWDERIYDLGLVHGGGNFHAVSTGDGFVTTLVLDPDEDGTDEYTEAEVKQAFLDYMNVDLTIYERLPDSIDATGHVDMWLVPVSDTAFIVSEFAGGAGETITDAGAADLISRGYTVSRTPAWTSLGTHYTYTNAAIVNNKVFIPWYSGYPTQNADALAVYQAAMPGYTIIQVDTSSIIHAAGAIHCVMKHVYPPCTATSLRISGIILDGESSPIAGVSLTADNAGGWDTTDASGYYEVCVPDGWSGTITPTKADFSFEPTGRSYVDVTSDIADQDYTGEGPVVVLGPDDFEEGFGNWPNLTGDDFDWTRDSGSTPSNNTGPSGDHTSGSGYYLFTEASDPRDPGDTAVLESPCIDLTGAASSSLVFWYHMWGGGMGTLEAQVASSAGTTCESLGGFSSAFSVSGDQGNQWNEAYVSLDSYAGGSIQIRLLGVIGSSYQSDIAIDDVVVTETPASVPAAVPIASPSGLLLLALSLLAATPTALARRRRPGS